MSRVRRTDLVAVREARAEARAGAGFAYKHSGGLGLFLDGPEAMARDAVRIIFAGEYVRADEPVPNPDVGESVDANEYKILSLDALVRNKLTAYRDKDRTHLRNLIDVGLIDESWYDRFPPVLAGRLKRLIETPGG